MAVANAKHTLNGQIGRIALPACLANLTSVIPSLVDNAFIGKTGASVDLGAMAIATSFCCFVLWAFGFLRLATAGLTAQAFGGADKIEMKAVFWRGCILAIIFGLFIAFLSRLLGGYGLSLYGADAETTQIAQTYWNVRMLAAVGDFTVYVVMGWLIGAQRASLVLVLQLILNLANIGLCAIFVLGFEWGVMGAGSATALAFAVTAFAGVAMVHRIQSRMSGRATLPALMNRHQFSRLMAINRDIFLRTVLLMAFLAYLVRLGAMLGPDALAANHVLFGFIGVIAQLLDGVTQATESLTGAAIGARNRVELVHVARATTLWSAGMACALAILLSFLGPSLLHLFTSNQAVLDAALGALPWLAFSPLIAAWCFQLDGIFLGATRSLEMRNGMVLAAIGAWLVSALAVPSLGNNGVWLSLYAFYALRALPLAMWYPRIVQAVPQPA